MILAYAVLVDYRVEAAKAGEVGVLRISFLKMLHMIQGISSPQSPASDDHTLARLGSIPGAPGRFSARFSTKNPKLSSSYQDLIML